MSRSTPLEPAARALLASQDGLPSRKPDDWSEEMWEDEQDLQQAVADDTWPDYVRDVRAVLLAIREPSEAMLAAGGVGFTREWTDPWDELSPEERETLRLPEAPADRCEEASAAVRPHAINTWKAMIDSLLGES